MGNVLYFSWKCLVTLTKGQPKLSKIRNLLMRSYIRTISKKGTKHEFSTFRFNIKLQKVGSKCENLFFNYQLTFLYWIFPSLMKLNFNLFIKLHRKIRIFLNAIQVQQHLQLYIQFNLIKFKAIFSSQLKFYFLTFPLIIHGFGLIP